MTSAGRTADSSTTGFSKSISRFEPKDPSRLDELERHYNEVHTRFMRMVLREFASAVSYHPSRAVSRYDIAGGWNGPLDAWRFVFSRYRGELGDRFVRMPASVRRQIEDDHRYLVRGIRSFHAEEEILVDRLNGQTTTVKYLIELDREPDSDVSHAAAYSVVEAATATIAAAAADAFGARLVVRSRVLAEASSRPIDDDGQGLPGAWLENTDKLAYLELYFDQQEWGDAFFASIRNDVDALLWDARLAVGKLYRVDETCGFDSR